MTDLPTCPKCGEPIKRIEVRGLSPGNVIVAATCHGERYDFFALDGADYADLAVEHIAHVKAAHDRVFGAT